LTAIPAGSSAQRRKKGGEREDGEKGVSLIDWGGEKGKKRADTLYCSLNKARWKWAKHKGKGGGEGGKEGVFGYGDLKGRKRKEGVVLLSLGS